MRDQLPLVGAQEEGVGLVVREFRALEPLDAFGLLLLEDPELLDGLTDGLGEPSAAVAGVFADNQEVGSEGQVVADEPVDFGLHKPKSVSCMSPCRSDYIIARESVRRVVSEDSARVSTTCTYP